MESPKRMDSPDRACEERFPDEERGCCQSCGQVVRTVGREMQVEVHGVADQAVVPYGVPAHDEAREVRALERGDDLGEPVLGGHNKESSQPRLPRKRSSVMSGCRA